MTCMCVQRGGPLMTGFAPLFGIGVKGGATSPPALERFVTYLCVLEFVLSRRHGAVLLPRPDQHAARGHPQFDFSSTLH